MAITLIIKKINKQEPLFIEGSTNFPYNLRTFCTMAQKTKNCTKSVATFEIIVII